jgi:hypothetical protein
MESVPGVGFESSGGINFGSLLIKLARSSESFESEEEPLDNTITLSAIFERKGPRHNN